MAFPPEITRLEHDIRNRGGTTFRTDHIPIALQVHKKPPAPDLKAQLVETLRENGRLRQELAQHKACLVAMAMYWEKTQEVLQILKDASIELSERTELAKTNFIQQLGVVL